MRWLPRSFRARLLISVVAVEVLASVALIALAGRELSRTADTMNRQRLDDLIPILTSSLARPIFERDLVSLERIVTDLVRNRSLGALAVYDSSGTLLVHRSEPDSPSVTSEDFQESFAGTVSLGGRQVGSVRVLFSDEALESAQQMARINTVIVAAIQLVASVGLLVLITLLLTRDFDRFHRVAVQAARGDWSVRVPAGVSKELAETREAFNSLLQSLQDADRLIREGEHHYRDLLQQSQQAILVLQERRPVFANTSCARLLGYANAREVTELESVEPLLAAPAGTEGAVPPDWPPVESEAAPRQIQLRRHDGSIIWIEYVGSAVHWRGRPAYQLLMQDVTQRRETEEALAASEARFREIVETSQEGIWITDEETRTIYANQRMTEMLGYTAEAMLGRQYLEFVPSDRHAAVLAALERNKGGAGHTSEGVLLRSDGSRLVVLANTTARVDAQGRYLGALGMFTDVTARRETERALHETERRLHTIVQNAPLILYALDRDGVFQVSEGRELTPLGRKPGEVVGHSAFEVFAHLPDRLDMIRRALNGESFSAEVDIDGQIFDAYHQPLFGPDGKVEGVIVVSVNISQRKATEAALQEAQLELNRVIDSIPVVVFTIRPDASVEMIRGQGLEAVNLKAEEVIGHSGLAVAGTNQEAAEALKRALEGEAVRAQVPFAGRIMDLWMQPLIGAQGSLERILGLAMDVTERVDAERRLQASEERFRDFAEASGDWLWETDAEHRLCFLSDSFTRITGRDPSLFLGRTRQAISNDQEERKKWDEYQRTVAAHEPLRDFVYKTIMIDGVEEFYRINGAPVFDGNGRFTGYRGTATDVTHQVRMQQALAQSEARFRNLLEGSLQGMLVADADSRLLFANQAMADIFGYADPQDLAKLRLSDELIHPDDRARIRGYRMGRFGGEERPTNYEFRGIRKDGSEIDLITLAHMVEWDGHPAVQITVVDITAMKAAERELRNSESKFRKLVEHSNLATFIFSENWELMFLNDAAARLFGYPSREVAQAEVRTGIDLVHEGDREMLARQRADRLAGKPAPPLYEFRGIRRDGQVVWLQNVVSTVEWEGQLASMSMSMDITAHKLREEALRQAQKMEVVGQLTGGVAHDFNNLLTVVLGNLELVQRRLGRENPMTELLAGASAAAERGAMLVQRLLAFSRKQPLVPEAVNLNRLVGNMTQLLRRTLQESIEIETVLGGGLWNALVDPNQLENALLNLAVNARDAMPQGGKLTIEAANARLDEEYAATNDEVRPGQYVMLAVSDTGTGMTADVLERAFEPFFTTKEVGQGSGLGLSMVYGFVKQSGGHVKIYSEVGQGTSIKLYLPRASSGTADRALLAPASDWAGHGIKVLVVEDDESVRDLAVAILASLEYTARAAENAAQALAILATEPDIAVLFTDVVLPGGKGGVELAREAQQIQPGIKVLFTSGYTENAIIHHGRLDEGLQLLEKPFRIDSLARKLRAVLEEP